MIEETVAFRVVSWNMNHWRQPTHPVDTREAGWRYLREELHPDVALLQETVADSSRGGAVIYREIADMRPWGSAVVTRPGLNVEPVWAAATRFSRRRFPLMNTFPGSVVVGEIELEDLAPITVVSVYTVMEVYAQTTMLRVVADLIPLFDSAKGSRVILAGDLNLTTATSDPYNLRRGTAVLGALESLGLVDIATVAKARPAQWMDCPCGSGSNCAHFATWNFQHLDHAYVSESLRDEVAALSVRRDAVELGLSDHAPLVIDLALSRRPIARQWDRDTAPPEFGRLLGPEAQRVVEQLIGWSEDKERRVGASDRRGVVLTRMPASKSIVPEMWLQIDFRNQRLPMYTVSLKGTGRVVVQFQWMLYPPFDTEQGRASLLAQLNEVSPEVRIGSERLGGRPDFPLAALNDPDAFKRFVAWLERIVDETDPSSLGPEKIDGPVDAEVASAMPDPGIARP